MAPVCLQDFRCQLEVGRTKVNAVTQHHAQEKEELQRQLAQLHTVLEEERAKVASMATKETDHAKDVAQEREESATLRVRLGEAEALVRERAEEAVGLQGELERLAADLSASREECSRAEHALAERTLELDSSSSEPREEAGMGRPNVGEETETDDVARDAVPRELERVRRALEEREAEVEALRQDNGRLEEDCRRLEEKGAWLENQIGLPSRELKAMETVGCQVDQLCSDPKSACPDGNLQSNVAELELELRNRTSALDSAVAEKDTLQQSLVQATAELSRLEAQAQELQSKLDSKEHEVSSLSEAQVDLTARLDATEQELGDKLRELETRTRDANTLRQEIAGLKVSAVAQEEELCALRKAREQEEGQPGKEGEGEEEEGVSADLAREGEETDRLVRLQSLEEELREVKRRCDEAERERESLQQAAGESVNTGCS